MAIAQTVARRHVMPWIDTEEPYAEGLYGAITQRFVNLVNDLLQRIAQDQSADFFALARGLGCRTGLSHPIAVFLSRHDHRRAAGLAAVVHGRCVPGDTARLGKVQAGCNSFS